MTAPAFYGDVFYVLQYRRDPKYKFADYDRSRITDREQAIADLKRLRTSAAAKGREFRLISRTTTIVEIEVPVE